MNFKPINLKQLQLPVAEFCAEFTEFSESWTPTKVMQLSEALSIWQ